MFTVQLLQLLGSLINSLCLVLCLCRHENFDVCSYLFSPLESTVFSPLEALLSTLYCGEGGTCLARDSLQGHFLGAKICGLSQLTINLLWAYGMAQPVLCSSSRAW